MSALTEALKTHRDTLVARAHDEMYANPFWLDRFGERGRRFAREDGRHHLAYLVAALEADSVVVLTAYATWLRTVLVTRGMCSRHLAQHFASLVDGICAAPDIPDAETACAYLRAAIDALEYDAGPAGGVQRAAPALGQAAMSRFIERCPALLERLGPNGVERCLDDLGYHLSYLADSLALERPDLFVDYIRWIMGFLERRAVPRRELDATLEFLAEAIDLQLPALEAAAARELLTAGRLAIATSAA